VIHDTTGLDGNVVVAVTPDASAYAYSFYRSLGQLFLADGLH
jgi:hypothetical protein